MTWHRIPIYAGVGLGTWLIIRLLTLKLHRVYKVFCAFLGFELITGLAVLLDESANYPIDYRSVWLCLAVPEWALTLWMVHELLGAVLGRLPGILDLSRKLLAALLVSGTALALASVFVFFRTARANAAAGLIGVLAWFGISMERAVGIAALLTIIGILAFVVWVPARFPRNLVSFSTGLAIYFLVRTSSSLAQAFLSFHDATLVYNTSLTILPVCYLYWAISITRRGEYSEYKGASWNPERQARLAHELERLNASLLRRSSGHLPGEPISGQGHF